MYDFNEKVTRQNAPSYIKDYLTNCFQDPADWDIEEAADQLYLYADSNNLSSFEAVPADVFTTILEDAELSQ